MSARPRWLASRARLALRAAILAWLGFLLLLLQACGGSTSDDEEDARQHIPTPPQCGASSPRCQ